MKTFWITAAWLDHEDQLIVCRNDGKAFVRMEISPEDFTGIMNTNDLLWEQVWVRASEWDCPQWEDEDE